MFPHPVQTCLAYLEPACSVSESEHKTYVVFFFYHNAISHSIPYVICSVVSVGEALSRLSGWARHHFPDLRQHILVESCLDQLVVKYIVPCYPIRQLPYRLLSPQINVERGGVNASHVDGIFGFVLEERARCKACVCVCAVSEVM